jgi:hypothetical protein
MPDDRTDTVIRIGANLQGGFTEVHVQGPWDDGEMLEWFRETVLPRVKPGGYVGGDIPEGWMRA